MNQIRLTKYTALTAAVLTGLLFVFPATTANDSTLGPSWEQRMDRKMAENKLEMDRKMQRMDRKMQRMKHRLKQHTASKQTRVKNPVLIHDRSRDRKRMDRRIKRGVQQRPVTQNRAQSRSARSSVSVRSTNGNVDVDRHVSGNPDNVDVDVRQTPNGVSVSQHITNTG